jgi:F-type H+-transporting ATPase subunit gamma
MESLRDIRRNIKSVKATQQIMKTMKMVASARIRRAQASILAGRPFAAKMEEMLDTLGDELKWYSHPRGSFQYRYCAPPQEKCPVALVVVTADKGLCGAFNATVIRAAVAWLRENSGRKTSVFCIGRKGVHYIKRIRAEGVELAYENTGIFPNAGYVHAELLGRAVLKKFDAGEVGEVQVIFNEFKSLVSQHIVVKRLLPLAPRTALPDKVFNDDFIFEPHKKELLRALLPRQFKAQLYRALLESQAAELAARMNAMESAGKNAGELLSALTLKLNRTRQSMITTEITEIVSGSEALNA